MKYSSIMALAIGVATVAQAFALEIPLKYAAYPDETRDFRPFGMQSLQMMQTVPPGEWKLPNLAAKVPLYGMAEFGDKKHLVVLDFTIPADTFYSRLFFDANANGDLTDDPVLDGTYKWENSGQYVHVMFKRPVEMGVSIGGKSARYSFRTQVESWFESGYPNFSKPEDLQNVVVTFDTNCSYSGGFDLDGSHYEIELGDRNMNGRFDDLYVAPSDAPRDQRIYGKGDSVYISIDGTCEYADEMGLGDVLVLGEKVFAVRVDTPESRLVLTPLSEGLASIDVPDKVERLVLLGSAYKAGIMVYRPGKAIKVPEGEYRVLSYQLLSEDAQGDLWLLNAIGTRKSPVVTVKQGGSTALAIGEPFRPLVTVSAGMRGTVQSGAKDGRFSFELRGACDEMVTEVARIRGNRSKIQMSAVIANRPKEPTYKIIKKDGEVAVQGQFEYG